MSVYGQTWSPTLTVSSGGTVTYTGDCHYSAITQDNDNFMYIVNGKISVTSYPLLANGSFTIDGLPEAAGQDCYFNLMVNNGAAHKPVSVKMTSGGTSFTSETGLTYADGDVYYFSFCYYQTYG